MKTKNKLISIFSNLDIVVAGIMVVILVVLSFAGVIWRRFFNAPFTWMEEVQLACLVWIVFGAGGAAFRTGNHVAIEMVVDLMPEKIQKFMTIFISVIVVTVIGYLFKQSLGFVGLFAKSLRATSILNIPFWLIYGIAPISYILMIVSYFYALVYNVESEVKEAINE